MTDDFPITIFHNPVCGTSRNALAMIRSAGYEPTVVEYLDAGWTRSQLLDLFNRAGSQVRAFIREKGTPAAELGLLGQDVPEETILQAMIDHPVVVNRPIVVTPKGVKLCRPSEAVLDLLENQPHSFTKEDGEIVRLKPSA
ncbi:arsenate reductase (glutaredoxin) [soil metagenome]